MAQNAMTEYSIKHGDTIKVGNTIYRGRPPEFVGRQAYPGGPVHYEKVSKGIPFVKVSIKEQ